MYKFWQQNFIKRFKQDTSRSGCIFLYKDDTFPPICTEKITILINFNFHHIVRCGLFL